jgi:hypothetical protein
MPAETAASNQAANWAKGLGRSVDRVKGGVSIIVVIGGGIMNNEL